MGGRAWQGFIMQITSLVLIKKFQTDQFKIPLLEKAETAIRLVTKFLVGDVA